MNGDSIFLDRFHHAQVWPHEGPNPCRISFAVLGLNQGHSLIFFAYHPDKTQSVVIHLQLCFCHGFANALRVAQDTAVLRYRLTVFFLVHFLQFSHIIEKFGIALEICQRLGVGLLDFFVNLHGNKRHICQFVPFLALLRGFLRKRRNDLLRNGCRDRFEARGK